MDFHGRIDGNIAQRSHYAKVVGASTPGLDENKSTQLQSGWDDLIGRLEDYIDVKIARALGLHEGG